MARVGVSIAVVVLCVAVGQALRCYKCDIGFWNLCVTHEMTCTSGQYCFSGTGKAVGVVDIKMKGCLASEDCNKVSTVEYFKNKTLYSMNKTCCDEDLCNGAPKIAQMVPLHFLAPVTILYVAL